MAFVPFLLFTLVACGGDESLGIRTAKRVDAAQAQRIQLDQLTLANRRLEVDIEQMRKAPRESAECPPGSVRLTPEGRVVLPRGGPVAGNDRSVEGSLPGTDGALVGGQGGRPG